MGTQKPPVRRGLPGAELSLPFGPTGERELGILNEKIWTVTWMH